uniref:Uncharacterized protein n=1 Tax=Dulem virus 42 TaxID=3145760 RepID=A0AAU8BB42_9CAUD
MKNVCNKGAVVQLNTDEYVRVVENVDKYSFLGYIIQDGLLINRNKESLKLRKRYNIKKKFFTLSICVKLDMYDGILMYMACISKTRNVLYIPHSEKLYTQYKYCKEHDIEYILKIYSPKDKDGIYVKFNEMHKVIRSKHSLKKMFWCKITDIKPL